MKKLCAGILSILLIFSLLPLAALGDETTTTTGSSSESSAPAADSKVTIVVSVLDKTAGGGPRSRTRTERRQKGSASS